MRENLNPGYNIKEYNRRIWIGNDINLDTTDLTNLRDKNIVSKTKSEESSKVNMVCLRRLANDRSPSTLRSIPITVNAITT